MSRWLPILDPFDEIKQIYYSTTRETIERDLARALDLLRQMPDDDARQRAAGLMHGLSDLKREWAPRKKGQKKAAHARERKTSKPTAAGTKVPAAHSQVPPARSAFPRASRGLEAPPPPGTAKKGRAR